MIIATRDEAQFAKLREVFPDGVEDRGARNYFYGWTLYARETVSFHVKRLFGADV